MQAKISKVKTNSEEQFSYLDAVKIFTELKPNYNVISKKQIDLDNGRNKNIFAYRGQFSPDLIGGLLWSYGKQAKYLLDPFVGCGTSLFAAAKFGINAYGVEINPAAIEMSKFAMFLKLNKQKRVKIINDCGKKINSEIKKQKLKKGEDLQNMLLNLSTKSRDNYKRNFFRILYLNLLDQKEENTIKDLNRAILKLNDVILKQPVLKSEIVILHEDARKISIPDNFIDIVITSPPYVNVFNYHQHNREFIDKLFGNALVVAKSEFGANRKHRQNRFYTLTQYALDMYQSFVELFRITKNNSRLIFIIGKESNINGVSFRDDIIITGIAYLAGFNLIERQERCFLNKFGQKIFESILHFKKWGAKDRPKICNLNPVYKYAVSILNYANKNKLNKNIEEAILSTIDNKILPSLYFTN